MTRIYMLLHYLGKLFSINGTNHDQLSSPPCRTCVIVVDSIHTDHDSIGIIHYMYESLY